MNIINLIDAQQHIPTIAAWHQAEWGYLNPGATIDTRIVKMQRYLKGASMPLMLICVDGEQVVGTAALVENDMDSHPELSPWLASVYVDAAYRKRGIGAALVKRLVAEARSQGFKALYLFSPDQAHFYQRLGWQIVAQESYRGSKATLMKIAFD